MNDNALFAALFALLPEAVVLRSEIDLLAARLAWSRVLAILADNSPAWAIADLAALRAGRVVLPLPCFFAPAQLTHALEQCAADAVLTDQPERIAALGIGFVADGQWQGLSWMRRERAAAGNSQDFVYLGQHRHAQGRVPDRRGSDFHGAGAAVAACRHRRRTPSRGVATVIAA